VKTSSISIISVITFGASSFAQLDPGIEANLLRQQIQNQKQYTPVDLSTDAGRKVYLLEHFPTRFRGTDRDRTLQVAADELAARDSSSKSSPSSGGSLYDSLKPSNPSLTKDELSVMCEAEIRRLFYNKYRQEGKNMGEARELSSKVAIPSTR
jgi:hypothetical protein